MAERKPIVFVLGAGASWPCGFPLGSDLVRDIMTRRDADHIFKQLDMTGQITMLQTALKSVGNQSIDDLLETRDDLRMIGKVAIAYELLSLENPDNLIPQTGDNSARANDRWYPTLFRLLRQTAPTPDEFLTLPIRFITFNYDRSFDAYWGNALTAQFGRKRSVVASLLLNPIAHIHGQLGFVDWQAEYTREASGFGTKPTAELLEKLMYWIRTPHDTHHDGTHDVQRAQR